MSSKQDDEIIKGLLDSNNREEMLKLLPTSLAPKFSLELSACREVKQCIEVCGLDKAKFFTIYTRDPMARALVDIPSRKEAERLLFHMSVVLEVPFFISYLS